MLRRPDVPSPTANRLAFILGSGLGAESAALLAPHGVEPCDVPTEFGPVRLFDVGEAVVLLRHEATDEGYLLPHLIDHRRSIAGLCAARCDRVLAIGSVGSLRGLPVGTVLAPDDFYAPHVTPTFYSDVRAHSAPEFARAWRAQIIDAWRAAGTQPLIDGGVYAQTLGPRFETPAEVRALARDADVVGMTMAAECILAGEAGLAYGAVCMVDNLGNGLAAETLTLDQVREAVTVNRTRMLADLRGVVPRLTRTA